MYDVAAITVPRIDVREHCTRYCQSWVLGIHTEDIWLTTIPAYTFKEGVLLANWEEILCSYYIMGNWTYFIDQGLRTSLWWHATQNLRPVVGNSGSALVGSNIANNRKDINIKSKLLRHTTFTTSEKGTLICKSSTSLIQTEIEHSFQEKVLNECAPLIYVVLVFIENLHIIEKSIHMFSPIYIKKSILNLIPCINSSTYK